MCQIEIDVAKFLAIISQKISNVIDFDFKGARSVKLGELTVVVGSA